MKRMRKMKKALLILLSLTLMLSLAGCSSIMGMLG